MPPRSALPGVVRRIKGGRNVWYWVASQLTTRPRFRPRTVRLWAGQGEPSPDELATIRAQAEQLALDLLDTSSRRTRKRGLVYFVRFGDHLKIGFTQDLDRRLSEMRTFLPEEPVVELTIAGSPASERRIHRRFDAHRITREWFRWCPAVISFIREQREVAR